MTTVRTMRTNRNNPAQSLLRVQLVADTTAVREETLAGKRFLVVPTIALKQGVVWPGNAPSPELALASEFAKFGGQEWNGRPIVFGHPVENNSPVSANSSPETLSREQIGFMFNTFVENNSLKTEMWIDLEKVEASTNESLKATIQALRDGQIVEVSTGIFVSLEESTGYFDDREYSAIWRDTAPDHLAILPLGTVGACSVEMGCGAPRLNSAAAQCSGTCSCGGQCGGNNMPEPKNTGGVPAGDGNTTAAGQQATNSAEGASSQHEGPPVRGLSRLMWSFKNLLGFRNNELSDVDTRKAIEAALRKAGESTFWMVAVFDNSFVYEKGYDGTLYQRSYNISPDGKVTIGEESVQVRPETDFIAVNNRNEENAAMADKKQKVDSLIANKATKFTDKDRAFLESLQEDQLDLLEPVVEAPKEPVQTAQTAQAAQAGETPAQPSQPTAPATNTAPAAQQPTQPKQPVTLQEYIDAAPAEVREVLSEGLMMQKQRKDFLVKGLMANANNPFTEEQLRAKGLTELEALAKLGRVPDFAGRAGGSVSVQAGNNDRYADDPPALFPVKTAS